MTSRARTTVTWAGARERQQGGTTPAPSPPLEMLLPAISALGDDIHASRQALRHTADGCYVPLRTIADGDHLLYLTVDGLGSVPSISGYTPHPLALTGPTNDQATVNEALADAINALSLTGVSASFDSGTNIVSISGVNAASSVAARGASIRHTLLETNPGYGWRGWRVEYQGTGATSMITTPRGMMLDPARMRRSGRVVGWGMFRPSTSGGQVRCSLLQGASDTTINGYTLLGDLGASQGSDTGIVTTWLTEAIPYDFANGNIAIAMSGDATNTVGFTATSASTPSSTSDFRTATGGTADGGAGLFLFDAASGSGSSVVWPATVTVTSTQAFYVSVFLIIQSDVDADGPSSNVVGYYGDCMYEALMGAPYSGAVNATMYANTSTIAGDRPAWLVSPPPIADRRWGPIHRVGIGTHDDSNPLQLSWATGGASDSDWDGATPAFDHVFDAANTGAANDTWAEVVDEDGVPFPDGEDRGWVMCISPAATSSLRFFSAVGTYRDRFLYVNGTPTATTPNGGGGENEHEELDVPGGTAYGEQDWTNGGLTAPGNCGAIITSIMVAKTFFSRVAS